jgi:hypothetical protein
MREELERVDPGALEANLGQHGEGGREPPCPGAKQRGAGRVDEQRREGRQHRGEVLDDGGDVDAGEPRHQRQGAVPERKGIARVWPAVRELVHGLDPAELGELGELARATRVHEPVGAERPRDPGDGDRVADPGRDHPAEGEQLAAGHRERSPRRGERGQRGEREETDRERDRGSDEQRRRERETERDEAPGERRRQRHHGRPWPAESARDEGARDEEHEARRDGQPQREAETVRRQEPDQCEEERRGGERGKEAQARETETGRRRFGQRSHAAASSASSPALRQTPPRLPTSSSSHS